MAITAPTPMMMPSMVRTERILWRDRARMAMRMIASKSICRSVLQLGQVLDDLGRDGPILNPLIAANLSVTKLNTAFSVLCDVGLVRHQHNRQALIIQLLKNVHDLD